MGRNRMVPHFVTPDEIAVVRQAIIASSGDPKFVNKLTHRITRYNRKKDRHDRNRGNGNPAS